MADELLRATQMHLMSAWNIAPPTTQADALTWELLLEELQARVLHLLRYNPRKLLNALYILDISERRYLECMDQPTIEDRALELARAILERESEKIETRRRYAAQREGGPPCPPRPQLEEEA
ncbi:MAG: hypothetical protein HYV26_22985 [Candidatus Hydrogenedentes bacterium]|nr:hypothetical protein [Candidatus Hydrogenedentota bacterium]MBI3117911.1 hypothetical protein [Candidatus Hydrogenedentota bacterium]